MQSANAPLSSDLSELEGGVLAIVNSCPGITAHVMRERFRKSRSSHWSGSAGAIYPLMKKLFGRELLAAEETKRGSRTRRTYTITAAGKRELKRWLGPPLPTWVASITFDPLRTRMPFLDALSPAKRLTFLREAETLLADELRELQRERRELTGADGFWEQMAADGYLATAQARLRWIRKTIEIVEAL